MKKRILLMVLALTMIIGILTGCGAGSDGSASGSTGGFGTKEITVSEMLNSIIEENGEVVMYTYLYESPYGIENDGVVDKDGNPKSFNEYSDFRSSHIREIRYDGKSSNTKLCKGAGFELDKCLTGEYTFDEAVKGYMNELKGSKSEMTIVTDEDDVMCERLTLKGNAPLHVYFGSFTREEIAGVSCMVFRTYGFAKENAGNPYGTLTYYDATIIKDTEFTKDKTVVLDSTSLEGAIVTDSISGRENYYTTYSSNWTPNK